jgi:hypothetical protein
VARSGRSILRMLRRERAGPTEHRALQTFGRLARPEAETGARSPLLDGRDKAGAATAAFFRRSDGSFLAGHYLTTEVTSPAIERCGQRMLRLRLMDLNGARHRSTFIHDAR